MSDDLDALRRENVSLRKRLADLELELGGDAAALLHSVLEAMPAIITRVDADERVLFLNRYLPGWKPKDVIGTSLYEYVASGDVEVARAAIQHVLRSGEVATYRITGSGPNGGIRHWETQVVPVAEVDGRRGACLVSLDISEHVERERALRSSEESLRIAVAATGMGLWRWDALENRAFWNEAMTRITGHEQPLTPDAWLDLLAHPEDRSELRRATFLLAQQPERPWPMHRIIRPDGAVRWVLPSGKVVLDGEGKLVSVSGGLLDVTDQRATEERLRQTQKLEALGSLTAGVAHNFNNMLAVILPYLEGATEHPACHDAELGGAALHAARRGAQMIRQLMTLAGGRPAGSKSVRELTIITRAAAEICEQLFHGQLELRIAPAEQTLLLICDEAAIEQSLVNLLLNARDALLDSPALNPRIDVRLRKAEPGAVPPFPGRLRRNYAVVEVQDNGIGMDEATRARMFEPFFTTKGPDRGTGLGLATSHAIVREHGGFIFCQSEPGVGTTFAVYLPLLEREERKASAEAPRTTAARRVLRVLVVEDDTMVRKTTVSILKAGGHDVTETASARAALDQLSANVSFDIVLLDRSMPGGGGASIVNTIRELAPAARIVFFTGGDVPAAEQEQVDAVLHKPVGASELLLALDHAARPRA